MPAAGSQQSISSSARSVPIGTRVVQALCVAYRARQPALLEGPTGIGKSEIVHQVASSLGIEFLPLDLSLLEPPDLVGLPQFVDGQTRYAPPAFLPQDGAGILLLEELNRAERYMQQPALQLLTARRLHEYVLPPGWATCAAINPEHEGYQVTPLDPALRARFLNLRVHADRREWLRWAEPNGVHAVVLQLARAHDDVLESIPPRTWTFVSGVLHALTPDEREDTSLLTCLLEGYLPPPFVQRVIAALAATIEDVGLDLQRLLQRYHRDADLQHQFAAFTQQGQTDRLHRVYRRLQELFESPELTGLISRREFSLDAFERLLADLPGDQAESLQAAFAANPVSARLIGVTPDEVLQGYRQNGLAQRIDGWVANPRQHHRLDSLCAALARHLQAYSDLNALRKNRAALADLGLFLEQVGADRAQAIREVCRQRQLEPIPPAQPRRKPR